MTTLEDPAPSAPKKSAALNIALLVFGLGLLAFSIWSNRGQIRQSLTGELRWGWMLQAFALHSLGVLIAFVRWFGLVRMLGIRIPLGDSLRLSFVGSLFNLIIPGAVGGDLVKAAYLARMQIPRTRVIASMVIDRLLGLLGLFLLAALAGLSAWPVSSPPVRRLTLIVLASTVGIILFLTLVFSGVLGRRSQKMAELNAMSAAYRGHLAGIAAWALASSAVHALNTVAFYRMSQAIMPNLQVGLLAHFQIVPLVLFSTAVPLPLGAIGFSENVSDQLFQNMGHTSGAVAMMGFRLLQYAFALVSALVYWANIRQMKNLVDQKWS